MLAGSQQTADDTDRLFLAWDEWRREAGGRIDQVLTAGRGLLTGNHDQQCEGLIFLARLAGANGQRPPGTEQSATDCRWSWSTPRRSQRRIWEVKTRTAKASTAGTGTDETCTDKTRTDKGQEVADGGQRKIARGDVNQLLGQLEVEQRRAPKARLYGCLLDPATGAEGDAIDAARDRIRFVSHEAAVRLYDLLADRLRQYAALCGDGSAEARGHARTHVEQLLPAGDWLAPLLSPARGQVLSADDVASLFPVR